MPSGPLEAGCSAPPRARAPGGGRALPRALAALALGLGLGGACTLVLDNELEGLPCDNRGACLLGYICQEGVCVVEPPVDSGPPPELPCGGKCRYGQSCQEPSTCYYDCATRTCPPGMACDPSDKRCKLVTGSKIGALCTDDVWCESGTCLKSATGHGICVGQPAAVDGGNPCAAYPNSFNRPFYPQGVPGQDGESDAEVVYLCVPSAFTPCTGQHTCDLLGLQCTFWTTRNPRKVVSACAFEPGVTFDGQGNPISADAGPDGGLAEINEPCSSRTCKTGLCIKGVSPATYCAAPCRTENDCRVIAHQCRLAPFEDVPPSVRMCLRPERTLLCDCGPSAAICGSDAPLCQGTGIKRCRIPCAKDSDCGNDACSDGVCQTSLLGAPDGGC